MARPSKLTDEQWSEITRRSLDGELAGHLAKEFGVSRSTVVEQVSDRKRKLKNVASQIVDAKQSLEGLPETDRVIALQLAEDLQAISASLAMAGRHGSTISSHVMQIAAKQSQKINAEDPMETSDVLQSIAALSRIANESSTIGVGLMKTAKDVQAAVPQSSKKTPSVIKIISVRPGGHRAS